MTNPENFVGNADRLSLDHGLCGPSPSSETVLGEASQPILVIQADREAAADLVTWHNAVASAWETAGGVPMQFFTHDLPSAVREGWWDDHFVVQAFARHRLASRPSVPDEGTPKPISKRKARRLRGKA